MAVSTIRDTANALWLGYQTTAGTFATPAAPLCWLTDPPRARIQHRLAKPRIQRLNRWATIKEFYTGEEVTIEHSGIVDTYEIGYQLTSLLGNDVYTGGPPTHVFSPGKVNGPTPQPLLSLQLTNGGYDVVGAQWEVYRFKDVRYTESRWRYNFTDGVFMYRATATGIYVDRFLVNHPTFSPLGAPLANPGVVFKRSGTAIAPVLSAEIIFRNGATPIIGSPAVAGTGPQKPSRISEGAVSGNIDLVYDSMADLNTSLHTDYLGAINAALTLVATAGSETLTISMPQTKYDTGELQPVIDTGTRQHVGGDWEYDTGIGSGVQVTLVGGLAARYDV